MASPSPGHGGIVRPIAVSGSDVPSARNWKCVPVGIEIANACLHVDFLIPIAVSTPHDAAPRQEVPDLLDSSVMHRD